MIPKAQLLVLANEEALAPTTIEKDYALGWILYGVSRHPEASKWVFKGGTCLKKCFFNTYRFSEDLDFTVPLELPYNHSAILKVLREVAEWTEAASGITFPRDDLTLEEYKNLRGKISFQGKASFVGPLQMNRHSQQRVKFDLTQDEIIADTPQLREINHPYNDAMAPTPEVLCYSVNEILAEKSRALYERQGRARDVYDVVHLSRAFRESVDCPTALKVVKAKFRFKGLPEPAVSSIIGRIDEGVLKANWIDQLAHQLPVLPDVQGFINDLPDALAWWLEPARATTQLSPISPLVQGETGAPRMAFPYKAPLKRLVVGTPRVNKATSNSVNSFIGSITYAGRNRLCLEIRYKDIVRLSEPYSIRNAQTGNTLLYVWERKRGNIRTDRIKAYSLSQIQNVAVADVSFTPRYAVEL